MPGQRARFLWHRPIYLDVKRYRHPTRANGMKVRKTQSRVLLSTFSGCPRYFSTRGIRQYSSTPLLQGHPEFPVNPKILENLKVVSSESWQDIRARTELRCLWEQTRWQKPFTHIHIRHYVFPKTLNDGYYGWKQIRQASVQCRLAGAPTKKLGLQALNGKLFIKEHVHHWKPYSSNTIHHWTC